MGGDSSPEVPSIPPIAEDRTRGTDGPRPARLRVVAPRPPGRSTRPGDCRRRPIRSTIALFPTPCALLWFLTLWVSSTALDTAAGHRGRHSHAEHGDELEAIREGVGFTSQV